MRVFVWGALMFQAMDASDLTCAFFRKVVLFKRQSMCCCSCLHDDKSSGGHLDKIHSRSKKHLVCLEIACSPFRSLPDSRRETAVTGFSGQQVLFLLLFLFRQTRRRITRRAERVRPRQPWLWSYQNVWDVATVRGLTSQRDIFREFKLIIQSPVGGGGGGRGSLQYLSKQRETGNSCKGAVKHIVFFFSNTYMQSPLRDLLGCENVKSPSSQYL